MKKLFWTFCFLIGLFSLSVNANSQLCSLFAKTNIKTPSEMAAVLKLSGVIKKDKHNLVQGLIQKTKDEYEKKNPRPAEPLCAEIEKALAKAEVLTFKSNLLEKKEIVTQPKIEIKPRIEVISPPKPIVQASPFQNLPKTDTYKIYTVFKNNYLSAEGKKDNYRKEIIEIINKALPDKKGNISEADIKNIKKELTKKNYLKAETK